MDRSSRRVLVVVADRRERRALVRLLGGDGYQVVTAEDAATARRLGADRFQAAIWSWPGDDDVARLHATIDATARLYRQALDRAERLGAELELLRSGQDPPTPGAPRT